MAEDLYQVLGVKKDATADEIRKAYRKLSRENHPDVKPDDKAASEKFKKVQEAYAVLGDAEKRAQYDRFGHAFNQAGGRTPPWAGGPGGGAGPIDIGDLFGEGVDLGDLFGGFGRGRRGPSARPSKGQDLRAEITVPFLVAAEGGQHEVSVNRAGRTERITVKIPAGLSDGSTIRLGGEGHPGSAGGPAGDLLLTIRVAPHPYFRRDGNDLSVEIPITPSEGALGAKVEAPTLNEGTVVVTLPPGTSSGRKLRLRGKGIPDRKTGTRGDLYVVAKVVVPESLTSEQRELFERLRTLDRDPRVGLW
ncbi:MAG: DnaJ domain-containing protein [Planctomycetota bacterium]|nr:DnaJ domain-containing protein [Planctomycetaceae bacterium]MDQ3332572.1 DnaJ domain-containing protein [Planctomycetota bacterium]